MTWNEILVAIVTSLIASVVFWLGFHYVPNTCERRKIKPLVDFDLYQIYLSLSHFLEIPFCYSIHCSPYRQQELLAGGLKKEDYQLYLATKCLTEEYKTIDDTAKKLIPIGSKLKEISNNILEQIQNLYIFNRYLTVEQIMLCRKIADKISCYDFEMKAFSRVGNLLLGPVDPTMRGMENMFYETYQLFQQLQDRLISRKPKGNELGDIYRSLALNELRGLYRQGKYKKVVKKAKAVNDVNVNSFYFRGLWRQGKTEKSLAALKEFLMKDSSLLVYMRGYFSEFKDVKQIKSVLVEARSEKEYQEMVDCINKENEQQRAFEQFAAQMCAFYDDKVKKA